jgi:hypothetical protein
MTEKRPPQRSMLNAECRPNSEFLLAGLSPYQQQVGTRSSSRRSAGQTAGPAVCLVGIAGAKADCYHRLSQNNQAEGTT